MVRLRANSDAAFLLPGLLVAPRENEQHRTAKRNFTPLLRGSICECCMNDQPTYTLHVTVHCLYCISLSHFLHFTMYNVCALDHLTSREREKKNFLPLDRVTRTHDFFTQTPNAPDYLDFLGTLRFYNNGHCTYSTIIPFHLHFVCFFFFCNKELQNRSQLFEKEKKSKNQCSTGAHDLRTQLQTSKNIRQDELVIDYANGGKYLKDGTEVRLASFSCSVRILTNGQVGLQPQSVRQWLGNGLVLSTSGNSIISFTVASILLQLSVIKNKKHKPWSKEKTQYGFSISSFSYLFFFTTGLPSSFAVCR